MGESWIVSNLNAALSTWNNKLAEIWSLLTESPQTFKGGQVWGVMTGIHSALQAIGYGLLVLFFAIGIMKTCGSFVEVKKPEHALKLFIRFALAKGAVTYGLELMLAVFSIVQGMVSTIITQSGSSGMSSVSLPQELIDAINNVGFWDSIPLWAVTLIGGLLITVLSFTMILTVYGRMFSLWMYAAIAPIMASAKLMIPKRSAPYYVLTANVTVHGKRVRRYGRFDFDPTVLKTHRQRENAAIEAALVFERAEQQKADDEKDGKNTPFRDVARAYIDSKKSMLDPSVRLEGDYEQHKNKANTTAGKETMLRRICEISPAFAEMPISKVNKRECEKFLDLLGEADVRSVKGYAVLKPNAKQCDGLFITVSQNEYDKHNWGSDKTCC